LIVASTHIPKNNAPKTFDQLAELHVAGLFAEAGWRIYFPHRDDGFDFIAVKRIGGTMTIRPVQVKGKYPEAATLDRPTYGFAGNLTQTHPEMVLAIPYFEVGAVPKIRHVAFMPLCMVKGNSRGSRCWPAKLVGGVPKPRGAHSKYFDHEGLKRLDSPNWRTDDLTEAAEDLDE
jgi:hypothetical protein